VIISGPVWFSSKRITKPKLKKNRNRTETGSNRPVSVQFFSAKTGSNCFDSVLAWFFRFGSVFPV
jgi:hypothetical protein